MHIGGYGQVDFNLPFAGLETNNDVRYNRNINGISGATISVNSIKKDIFKLTNTLKESITK